MPHEQLLTTAEVGRILGKSARTIQRAAEANEIPVALKLPGPNGHYLFNPADIDRLLIDQAKDAG